MRKRLPLALLIASLLLPALLAPAIAQDCSVDHETLSFGAVLLGEQRLRVLMVTNDGGENLPLDVPEQPCPEEPAFTVITSGHFDVAPGETRVLQLRFAPTTAGAHLCELDLGTNDCPPIQLNGWGQEYSEPTGNHIGLYLDPDAQICQVPLDGPSMQVQVRVLAVLPYFEGGVTAAEFRVDNLPENLGAPDGFWTATWNTDLVIGDVETGIALAFYPPLEGTVVEMGTLTFYSLEQTDWIGPDHTVDVLPSIASDNLVVVNTDFEEIPVGGGHFTFNCSSPPDCPCFEIGEPLCLVQPPDLNFGLVPVGSTAYQGFTISNGGEGPLNGIVSEDCEDFAIVAGEGLFTLNPGEHQDVQVRFQPSSAGEQTCVIDLGTERCPEVPCVGTGYSPVPICDLDPSTLDFGDIPAGGSLELSATLTNIGEGVLEGEASESCTYFELIAGAGPFSLGENESRTLTLRFSPPDPGDYACSVDLNTEYCDPLLAVGMAHEPIESCTLTPETLDFGDLVVGASLDLEAVLLNTGDLPLEGEIAVDHPEFSVVVGGGPFALEPGAGHSFAVRYEPVDPGTDNATLTTGLPACAELPLTGMAHEPTPLCVLVPSALDFGELLLGNATVESFQVQNQGDGPLVGEVSLLSEDFELVEGEGPFTLPPGHALNGAVRYMPTTYGPHEAAVELGTEYCDDLPLSGFGRNPSTGGDHLGLFLDEAGTLCSGDLPPYTHTPLYLIAMVPSFADPGITGAEFRVDGLADLTGLIELTPDWVLPPSGGDLENGIRFSFDAQPGEQVLLGTLDIYPLNELGENRVLMLAPSLDGDQLRVDDGDGLGWDVGGGRFTINCTDPELCDCIDFSVGFCELSDTEIDFGTVVYGHTAYRDFTITNVGYTTLAGELQISGQYFTLTQGEGPFLLEPGQVLEGRAAFQPGGLGEFEATITTDLADCPEIHCVGIGSGGGGGNPHLGIYADLDAVICELDQIVYETASVYVIAILPQWLPAITAAEFGIDNLPETGAGGIRTDDWNTDLVIGEPGYGVALAFSPPLSGPNAFLGTLDFFEIEENWIGIDHRIEVRESYSSGSLVVVGTDFVEYQCSPGFFTFNCTGGLPYGCDCVVATPVLLGDFALIDLGGAARLDWSYLGAGSPEFRLEARRDGLSWLVPYEDLGAGRYRAEDHAAALGTPGELSYRLLGRLPGEDWQLLREATLQVSGAVQRTALLPAHPNPFNPQVTVPFSLSQAGPARLVIYDVSGRRVATLVDGERPAGPQSAVWQGRDDDGHSLGSGVYFVQLEAAGFSETQKLVLMR